MYSYTSDRILLRASSPGSDAPTIASIIIGAITSTLEETPPEISADLVDLGIVLAGGGSLVRGIDRVIQEQTGLPVRVAKDPLTAVARGTQIFLENLTAFRSMLAASEE